MTRPLLTRDIPAPLAGLADLALDLRWTWSHAADDLWRAMNPDAWERTRNPWHVLQDVPTRRLEALARDARFLGQLRELSAARGRHLEDPGWYGQVRAEAGLRTVAYLSMEFGLGEALPLYAGGLGILAGDYLKTASDLNIPAVGVGLLYQVGYARQMIDAGGWQHELYPYNDPMSLPIQPVASPDGGWLHVSVELPGRPLLLRVWQARVGRAALYLLDSNDPMNSPADRGVTAELYGGGPELRLVQEIVLGIGGWRVLEALGIEVDVCHINEGHAAFVVLARAGSFKDRVGVPFQDALWATRAGNVFTTHTSVAAGFDAFPPELIEKYFAGPVDRLGLTLQELLGLGRADPSDAGEPFHMAYLAMRGCAFANGVSRLHGTVSRRLFRHLYPRWPEREVPVAHVTNGVHVPSWDSRWADHLWTYACGKARWAGTVDPLPDLICGVPDDALWRMRAEERGDLVRYARARLARQLAQRGASPPVVAEAAQVLDPDTLTLGFARRFAAYKRPNLLLTDGDRLARILAATDRPVQIIVAGKAHPGDDEGKRLVRAWIEFVAHPTMRRRAVFLEDYDIALAQELVQGVDVWINTPRRPWEASGTSGMKVLANGGLNLSELDGWWAEGYAPEAGWALGDGQEHAEPDWDAREADALYRLLEEQIVPEFYARDGDGIPRAWVARIRASISALAPRFSTNRMMREYLERAYLPAAHGVHRRSADGGRLARELRRWAVDLETRWSDVQFGELEATRDGERWVFAVQVYLGRVAADGVRVELYAEPSDGGEPVCVVMARGEAIEGAANAHVYRVAVPATRPSWHFTPRVVPGHPAACVPAEVGRILWLR